MGLIRSRPDEVCVLTQKPDGSTRTTQLINYLSLTNGTAAEEDQDYERVLHRVKLIIKKATDRCHFVVLRGAGFDKSRSESREAPLTLCREIMCDYISNAASLWAHMGRDGRHQCLYCTSKTRLTLISSSQYVCLLMTAAAAAASSCSN